MSADAHHGRVLLVSGIDTCIIVTQSYVSYDITFAVGEAAELVVLLT